MLMLLSLNSAVEERERRVERKKDLKFEKEHLLSCEDQLGQDLFPG